ASKPCVDPVAVDEVRLTVKRLLAGLSYGKRGPLQIFRREVAPGRRCGKQRMAGGYQSPQSIAELKIAQAVNRLGCPELVEEIVEGFGPRRGERQRLVLHAAKAVCDRGKKRQMRPQRSGEKWQGAGVFPQERTNGNRCGRGVGFPGLGSKRQLSAGNLR